MLDWARMTRLFTVAFMLALVLGSTGVPAALAASETSTGDSAQLIKVSAARPANAATDGPVSFNAVVDYQLQTVPRAFFLLFVFEDGSNTSTSDSSAGIWISAGRGELQLTTTYRPTSGTHTLKLVAALFRDENTLLTWAETQPFSLAQAPGGAMLAKALAARQDGDYAKAVDDLNAAIQAAPNIGSLYCWRADSRLHLGQYNEAVADYTRALSLAPNDRSCRVGRAIANLWKGQPAEAVPDLNTVIDQSSKPDRWTIWALRARGVANADLGQFSNASADYQAYLSLVPNVADRTEIESWISDLHSAGGTTQSNGPSSPS